MSFLIAITEVVALSFLFFYGALIIIAFKQFKLKQTKLAFYYFLTCFLTFCTLFSYIGEELVWATFQTAENDWYRALVLLNLILRMGIYLCLYIIANTFFFRWSTWTELSFLAYSAVVVMIAIFGLYNNFGWVTLENQILNQDFSLILFSSIIPSMITLYLAYKFTNATRNINPSQFEQKRATQLIAIGYWLYLYPFLAAPFITLLTFEFRRIIITSFILFPFITYILLYIGFYKPDWFKMRYREISWVGKQLTIDTK
ncbi:MAG: hypothetical protein ACFFC7_16710 [Candidatus Hermodarchaeota archaeon]